MIAGTILLGMAGCIPTSLQPLYTEKDLIFDSTLVGVWSADKNAKETWNFQKAGEKEYKLIITDEDGASGQFQTHLLKLGDTLFLDFFPDNAEMDAWKRSGYYKLLLQPMHSFVKVDHLSPDLRMLPLDTKWLRQLLKKNPEALPHANLEPDKDEQPVVITASTKELQAFAIKYLKSPEAYGDAIELKRAK